MEYLELYDENRQPLNRLYRRGDPLQSGEFIHVVGVWVVNHRGELLLTKRDPGKRYAPNTWENTGGHVAAGETAEEAVLRELQEETGIVVTADRLHFLGTAKVPPCFGDNYIVRLDEQTMPAEIRLQPGETCDAKWVTYAQFKQMVDRQALAPSVMAHLTPLLDRFHAYFLGRFFLGRSQPGMNPMPASRVCGSFS